MPPGRNSMALKDSGRMPSERAGSVLIVDLEGYEGPLDVLLDLSRKQKVDLRRISILRLAEQYAEFIENARTLKISLAADYLVMAAWLALIKSRLLLPKESPQEESENEMAARLAFRLQRLNAMREQSKAIMGRSQMGRDFFARGEPEQVSVTHVSKISANVLDLTQAYARMRSRDDFRPYMMNRDPVYSVEAATANLERLLGEAANWQELMEFLPAGWTAEGKKIRSAAASTLAAALELAKQGRLTLRQSHAFGPIQVKGQAGTDGE